MPGRVLRPLAVSALLLLPALAQAGRAGRQAPVELEGWDISALDAKVSEAGAGGRRDKKALADAYLERANFFYNAGRPAFYKLAAGDFRRALRLRPGHREARRRLRDIVSVYESLGRPVPAHGEEGDVYNDPSARYGLRPQPVTFAPGEKTRTLSETLPRGVAYVYELGARAGQRVSAELEAGGGGATFDVSRGPIESPAAVASEVTGWEWAVPSDGRYLIRVKPRRGATEYRLKVTVE